MDAVLQCIFKMQVRMSEMRADILHLQTEIHLSH